VAAGYSDVSVMSDGIEGWKQAGKPVDYPDLKESKNS
jgi:rhodanese-related sulfurtransferase